MVERALQCRPLRDQRGGSLPGVLIAIAVGAILMGAFLSHVSSRMLATQSVETSSRSLYSADAGIEFGIWKLLNDSTFKTTVDNNPGSAQTVSPATDINGISSTVTVTAELSWAQMADTPLDVGSGGSLALINDFIFALQGANANSFWRYDINNDSWTARANAPDGVGDGGSLTTRDGDTLFALRGNGSTDFWEYKLSTNSWNPLPDTDYPVSAGGALSYAGGGFTYAFSEPRFCVPPFFPIFCFDPVHRFDDNQWDRRSFKPDQTGSGAALAPDGNGGVYAFRGDNTDDFWYYQPNSWDQSPADPGVPIGAGGNLTSDETRYIYALRGNNTDQVLRYDMNTDSWTTLANTPESIGPGGSLVYAGDNTLYAMRGGGTTDFWRLGTTYDIRAFQDGELKLYSRVLLNGGAATILFWDVQ